jgi:hypothetical protein
MTHHLVHEVAGQPVRRGNQHQVEGGPRRLVPQRVQARPVQPRAAAAVIAKDVLVGDGPPLALARRDEGLELGDLLLDLVRPIPPVLPIRLLAGLPPDFKGASHAALPLLLPHTEGLHASARSRSGRRDHAKRSWP